MSRINQDKEIWRDIPEFEGLYQASNKGRIKSFWFWSNVTNQRYYREKIMKPKVTKDKFSRVDLWRGGNHKTYLTYRLVLCAFTNKPYDYDMTVNHKDGNRLNNNIENLEWLSLGDNIRHGFETGLYHYPKIEIYNKETGEMVFKGSKTKGSLFMGYAQNYLSKQIMKNIFSNDQFYWQIESEASKKQ